MHLLDEVLIFLNHVKNRVYHMQIFKRIKVQFEKILKNLFFEKLYESNLKSLTYKF